MKERITEHIFGGYTIAVKGKIYYDEVAEIAERLAEYEDAEEDGLLVRLPCKVGDKVYCVNTYYATPRICVYRVSGVCIRGDDLEILCPAVINGRLDEGCFILNANIFFTREEAEKLLKELGYE